MRGSARRFLTRTLSSPRWRSPAVPRVDRGVRRRAAAAQGPDAAPWPAANPTPGRPQIGISDTSSAVRPGDLPPQAPRPAALGAGGGRVPAGAQGVRRRQPDRREAALRAGRPRPTPARTRPSTRSASSRSGSRTRAPRRATGRRSRWCRDYEPAIIAYAMLLAKKGQISEAERFLTEKRGQMPKSAAVAATLAEVKSLQKDTGSAQRIAQEALKLNPDYRPAMVIIARDHYRNRRLDLALYALQAILDGFEPVADNPPRDKDNGEALLLRGLISKEQGNRVRRHGPVPQGRRTSGRISSRRASSSARRCSQAGGADEALPILEGAVRYDADNLAGAPQPRRRLPPRPALRRRQARVRVGARARREPAAGALRPRPALPLRAERPRDDGQAAGRGGDPASSRKFRELRPRDEKDDSEELLNSAKLKEGEINAASAPPPPAAAADARCGGRRRRGPAGRRRGAAQEEVALEPALHRADRRMVMRTMVATLVAFALVSVGAAASAQDKGTATRRHHARGGDDHRPHPEADRRRRREPHRSPSSRSPSSGSRSSIASSRRSTRIRSETWRGRSSSRSRCSSASAPPRWRGARCAGRPR